MHVTELTQFKNESKQTSGPAEEVELQLSINFDHVTCWRSAPGSGTYIWIAGAEQPIRVKQSYQEVTAAVEKGTLSRK
ncbi:MAG: hypothetical protein K2X93_14720 [Candidatus Obscuribacterales bacterium]|nr:hypothetical protein [Candidatus Obscuribacterales bacterium]